MLGFGEHASGTSPSAATTVPVVILCGGRGSRMNAASGDLPKPLTIAGDSPLLLHVMRWFAAFGHRTFALALGHRGKEIGEYFGRPGPGVQSSWFTYADAVAQEPWEIVCVDTGVETGTAYRLRQCARGLGTESVFVAYGDTVGTVDLDAVDRMHDSHAGPVTITVAAPRSRYGEVVIDETGRVAS